MVAKLQFSASSLSQLRQVFFFLQIPSGKGKRRKITRHSNFHSFCINPAGWCLRSPIPFSFSLLVVFFSFLFSFLPPFHFPFLEFTVWYFLLPQARGGASVLPLPAGWVPAGLGIWGGGGGCPPQAGRGPCLLPHWQELDLVLEPPGIGTRAFLGFLLLFLMP